jgi:hypothetical protein
MGNEIEVFNKKINDLIEQEIEKVEYYGLRIISEELESNGNNDLKTIDFSDYKTKFDNIHSFEIALSLHMKSGDIFDFIWNNIFYCYGIDIIKNGHENYENESVKKWNMTEDNLWKKYINKKIFKIDVVWESNTGTIKSYTNGREKIERVEEKMNPVTCIIYFFESEKRYNRVFISASGIIGKNDEIVFRGHDNIMVMDNINNAVEFGLI